MMKQAERKAPVERFRRQISLGCPEDGLAVGWLEDDFHHFGISLRHDGHTVQDISVAAVRFPWTTCPGAELSLRSLIGQPLVERASDVGLLIEMRQQCTHLFDLSGLLLSFARRRRPDCLYEAIVPMAYVIEEEFPEDREPVRLLKNGVSVLEWRLTGDYIAGSAQSLGRGFRQWTEGFPYDEAEWATILRRAVTVAKGRSPATIDLEAGTWSGPDLCYSLNQEKFAEASRISNQIRNFDTGNLDMLALRRTRP